jgi:hypothetical protein
MSLFIIIASLVALVIIGIVLWRVFKSNPADPGTVYLLNGSMSGKTTRSWDKALPRSFNQSQGATFTYTGWIVVDDFTFNYGNKRLIFSKGDCPGVYLDGTSNSLIVVVDTYGSKESILISNIPAKKWIHLGIVVDQDAVDIYINGVIRQHHTLIQLPKQNDQPVRIGAVEGFDGAISGLTYQSRSLNASEIDSLSKIVPTDDAHLPPAGPQYFDMSWYTGRV